MSEAIRRFRLTMGVGFRHNCAIHALVEVDMLKLNKLRLTAQLDVVTARDFLGAHEIDPSEVREVVHFPDGSMSVIMRRGKDMWHLGFEFAPVLTADLALAFKAFGIRVDPSLG